MPFFDASRIAEFAADVREGLSTPEQKELFSKYFYDEIGSALFEVITLLPEYGLTRADERLLQRHTADVVRRLSDRVVVAELGSGSGAKTRQLLGELAARGQTTYYPIDVSAPALARCRREMSDVDSVRVVPLEATYVDGLRQAARQRPDGAQLLVLFLGSTIGNFDRLIAVEFLTQIRKLLHAADVLYLSTDLEKPLAQVLAAYNDSLGVTAAFNLNILARINRELDANFDLSAFEHLAIYNEKDRRIEMHLRSKHDQTVAIRAGQFTVHLREGETIWTESSHKFNLHEVAQMARCAGFHCEVQWVDEHWPFAQSLLVAR